jgi:hypothetical protein
LGATGAKVGLAMLEVYYDQQPEREKMEQRREYLLNI